MNVNRWLSVIIALALMLGGSALAMAGNGSGGGSGSGENRSDPITVVNSSLADGAVIEGDTLTVHLEFNKNVVHFSVRQNNMGRFSLYDESGERHPLEVHMGDDQVDPTCKRLVDLTASGLQPGDYTLVIESGLTAKNGTSLDRDIAIRFTVAGEASAAGADEPPEDEAATEQQPAGETPADEAAMNEPRGEEGEEGASAEEPAADASPAETPAGEPADEPEPGSDASPFESASAGAAPPALSASEAAGVAGNAVSRQNRVAVYAVVGAAVVGVAAIALIRKKDRA